MSRHKVEIFYYRHKRPSQPEGICCCISNGSNISSFYHDPDCSDMLGNCQNTSEPYFGQYLYSHDALPNRLT